MIFFHENFLRIRINVIKISTDQKTNPIAGETRLFAKSTICLLLIN
jgi:hypothetical protein